MTTTDPIASVDDGGFYLTYTFSNKVPQQVREMLQLLEDPEETTLDLDPLWRAYARRFDLEHTFRFLKQTLGWTTPRVRHPESRPTGGRGWLWSLSPNSGWRARASRICGCRGSAATTPVA